MQDVRRMKASPLTVEEKECIEKVITCDYLIFFMFDFCRIISSIPTAISGAEDIQKRLDISLEVCSAT